MKANEAPEKLYFYEDEPVLNARSKKRQDANIEYIRADAFVEKACAWFRTLDDSNEPPYETTEEFIEGFKKAMKGE